MANTRHLSPKSQSVLKAQGKKMVQNQLIDNKEFFRSVKRNINSPDEILPMSPKQEITPKASFSSSKLSSFSKTNKVNQKREEVQSPTKIKSANKQRGILTAPLKSDSRKESNPSVAPFSLKEKISDAQITIASHEYEFFLNKYNERFVIEKANDIKTGLCDDLNENVSSIRMETYNHLTEESDLEHGYELKANNNFRLSHNRNPPTISNTPINSVYDPGNIAQTCKAKGAFKFIL